MDKHYRFFCNRDCEYFPCHKTKNEDDFNCMFCYCPLYPLGEQCGGDFTYTDDGVKDCTGCMIPHRKDAYDYISSRCKEVAALAMKKQCDSK